MSHTYGKWRFLIGFRPLYKFPCTTLLHKSVVHFPCTTKTLHCFSNKVNNNKDVNGINVNGIKTIYYEKVLRYLFCDIFIIKNHIIKLGMRQIRYTMMLRGIQENIPLRLLYTTQPTASWYTITCRGIFSCIPLSIIV